jgi:hypothetical protein
MLGCSAVDRRASNSRTSVLTQLLSAVQYAVTDEVNSPVGCNRYTTRGDLSARGEVDRLANCFQGVVQLSLRQRKFVSQRRANRVDGYPLQYRYSFAGVF